jgi:hypothetical protein
MEQAKQQSSGLQKLAECVNDIRRWVALRLMPNADRHLIRELSRFHTVMLEKLGHQTIYDLYVRGCKVVVEEQHEWIN